MPLMPSPSPTTAQTTNPRRTLLHPHDHHLSNRTSFETLTSVASSSTQDQAYSPKQLRRPTLRSYHSDSSQHNAPLASNSRSQPRHLLSHPLVSRASSASLPPVRDMPAVLTHFKEVRWQPAVGEADQFVEGPAEDEEMIPAGLDLSLGSLYGFPYCMGVPNAMEQRAQDLAEAEEAEYQRERKEKARLSARVSSTLFKKVSLQSALSWTRRGQR